MDLRRAMNRANVGHFGVPRNTPRPRAFAPPPPAASSAEQVAERGAVCLFCMEGHEDGNEIPLIQPCSTCKAVVHMGCLFDWRKQCRKVGAPPTCPSCRADL